MKVLNYNLLMYSPIIIMKNTTLAEECKDVELILDLKDGSIATYNAYRGSELLYFKNLAEYNSNYGTADISIDMYNPAPFHIKTAIQEIFFKNNNENIKEIYIMEI